MSKATTTARRATAANKAASHKETAGRKATTEDAAQAVSANAAQAATDKAAAEGRLPAEMAVTDPAPATSVDSPSGAIVEDEIKRSIPLDHPAVDSNPRSGTSAVQNGGDYNDPQRRHPSDPDFVGQGLDLSVYGERSPTTSDDDAEKAEK